MLKRALFVVVLAVHALACGSGPPTNVSGAMTLPNDVAQRVTQGVFEVVVAREPDGGVTYTTPLERFLPAQLRDQKFFPLGTAFAVSETRFVTAAHVVGALPGSALYLRDRAGATYEIARITRYSERRDLAVFEVAQPPPHLVPLETRANVAVGESVFTLGNAGGEGIVIRGGAVTSFSPEPASGEWQQLRSTAPSSPGNSGGPLVDAAGRVLGVVHGTNRVNAINVAIPMAELEKLPGGHADFSRPAVRFTEDRREVFVDVAFTVPLPSPLAEFGRAAREGLLDGLARGYAQLEAKFGPDLFPTAPAVQTYLQEPNVPVAFGAIGVDGNGTWNITSPTRHQAATVGGKKMYFVTRDNKEGEFLLERPRGMPLSTYFESPAAIGEAALRTGSWTVKYAGREVAITSLGGPRATERWLDVYGRPWHTFSWALARTEESVVFHCLPNPAGWACLWRRMPASLEDASRASAKRHVSRVTFTYYGLVRDWTEFLALPARYKPKVLSGADVRLDKDLTVKLGPLVSERMSVPFLSADSMLFAYVTLDSSSLHEQRIIETSLRPRAEKSDAFGAYEVFAPRPGSPEVQANRWAALAHGSAPFDGIAASEGPTMAIKRGVKARAIAGRERSYLVYCRGGLNDSKPDLEASCAKFREALKLDTPSP